MDQNSPRFFGCYCSSFCCPLVQIVTSTNQTVFGNDTPVEFTEDRFPGNVSIIKISVYSAAISALFRTQRQFGSVLYWRSLSSNTSFKSAYAFKKDHFYI